MERENRKPDICSCTTVQPSRKRRCVFGPSHWHRLRRIFGPAAEISYVTINTVSRFNRKLNTPIVVVNA